MRWSTAVMFLGFSGIVATPALPQAARPTRLVLAAYGDASESRVAARILVEAYRRLGITLDIQYLAGDLGMARLESGAVDGLVARVDGIEQQLPTVVQVPVPVTYVDVAVYSRDATRPVRDWRDLTTLTVATVRGVFYLERSIGDLRVRYVDTYAELYPLLLTRQVDAIVASDLQSKQALRSAPGVVRNAIIASYMLYHYLARQHQGLVAPLERELRQMMVDGTVARLREAAIGELARRPAATR